MCLFYEMVEEGSRGRVIMEILIHLHPLVVVCKNYKIRCLGYSDSAIKTNYHQAGLRAGDSTAQPP